jgi:hypothetical protein
MAKKPINLKTKLSKDSVPPETGKSESLAPPFTTVQDTPTSFRLTQADLKKLDEMVNYVNKSTAAKITRTSIIKALISMGSKIKKDRIVRAFKESL